MASGLQFKDLFSIASITLYDPYMPCHDDLISVHHQQHSLGTSDIDNHGLHQAPRNSNPVLPRCHRDVLWGVVVENASNVIAV